MIILKLFLIRCIFSPRAVWNRLGCFFSEDLQWTRGVYAFMWPTICGTHTDTRTSRILVWQWKRIDREFPRPGDNPLAIPDCIVAWKQCDQKMCTRCSLVILGSIEVLKKVLRWWILSFCRVIAEFGLLPSPFVATTEFQNKNASAL